jgi:VanZ family protein
MKPATHSTFGARLVGWVLLGAIAVMTLGPIGLRPQTHFPPEFERFAAYVVLGTLFALAYPRRRLWLLGALLIGAAGALEIGQWLAPGRDPHLSDFLFKAAGAVVGLVSLRVTYLAVRRRRHRHAL